MRIPLLAANWKMNKTNAEAEDFIQKFLKNEINSDREVVLCGPYTVLSKMQELLAGTKVGYGAQNFHWEESGAYTGEISADMLQELGCSYVIIGHSERRRDNNETDETVHSKIFAALDADFVPIVCVGESLIQRKNNEMVTVVENQLKVALDGLSNEQLSKIVVAYEPIWAIGTGETATPEQAQEMHAVIRKQVNEETRILYGGSVKPDNVVELMQQADIDGALVGGASLKSEDFIQIVNY
ncbi:MAG: triose-phosphate isomerase [bacterium]|nr:triose-phosphate isomerase [bacterium]